MSEVLKLQNLSVADTDEGELNEWSTVSNYCGSKIEEDAL
ncbi:MULTISPECIES: class III lanthipeptide [Kitasatospora]|nr:class III lanthipeptide [Kitasatospora fiedleri]